MTQASSTSGYALRLAAPVKSIEQLAFEQAASQRRPVGAGRALVRVMAAAINPSDAKAALGLMPHASWPRTPGRDFAGVVEAGPDEWIGREVYGCGGDLGISRDGSHARYLELPVAALRAKPRGLTMEEAGAVGVPFVTAYEGLRRSGFPRAGQAVMVLGANGKVGQAAVQLAAQAGARVLAVQRGPGPHAGFACGPVDAIDATACDVAARARELTGGRGVDIVYNTVGSAYFAAANAAMGKGATQIFIATHERAVPFDIFAFYRGMHTYVGIDSLALDCVASGDLLEQMRPGFEAGTLRPFPVARQHGLQEAVAAYQSVFHGARERTVLKP